MKFIGQFIQSFIARFRDSVFFESVENADSDTDKFLVIGSSGKLKYRTGTQVLSDIGAGTATGDITSVAVTTDTGAPGRISVASGDVNITLEGSNGVGVTNSGSTITAQAVPGEIDHDSLLNFVANEHIDWTGSSAGTIHSTNIPTLNQDTTGSAATLTASTSNALGIGSIELGHASDTTLSRSAAGTLAVEGKNVITQEKVLYIKQGSFVDDCGTDRIYFPMAGTVENTSSVGATIPFLAPVGGKILKIHWRTNKNHSGQTTTFALANWDPGDAFTTGNAADLGTKAVTPSNQNNVTTIDFQTGVTGTNAFNAGDTLAISMQNSSAINAGSTTKYWFSVVFEFDFSSY